MWWGPPISQGEIMPYKPTSWQARGQRLTPQIIAQMLMIIALVIPEYKDHADYSMCTTRDGLWPMMAPGSSYGHLSSPLESVVCVCHPKTLHSLGIPRLHNFEVAQMVLKNPRFKKDGVSETVEITIVVGLSVPGTPFTVTRVIFWLIISPFEVLHAHPHHFCLKPKLWSWCRLYRVYHTLLEVSWLNQVESQDVQTERCCSAPRPVCSHCFRHWYLAMARNGTAIWSSGWENPRVLKVQFIYKGMSR